MKTSQRIRTARRLVSGIYGEWNAPPKRVPYDHQTDGALLGNGDLGVALGGEDGAAIWHMAKVDFWESRGPFPSGGPRPIGCVRITGPKGGWHAEQHIYTAQVDCRLGCENAPQLLAEGIVCAQENLFLVRLTALEGKVEGTISLTPHPATGAPSDRSITETGATSLSRFLYRGFTDEGVAYPSEAMAALTVLPRDIPGRTQLSQFFGGAPSLIPLGEALPYCLEAGQTCTIVVSVATNHDAAAYRTMAIERAESIEEEDIPTLVRLHRGWWERFYAHSYVEFNDPVLMDYYYASFYLLASCSRNPKFPPGLLGVWITTDQPAWASDFHFNYNHEAPWWACYTAGHLELTEPYERPMLEYVPRARDNARKYEGCRGIYFDVGIGPQGFASSAEPNHYEDNHYFLGQKSNAAFIATNMIMRWRKTYDLDYAARIYGFLKDVVLFYQDYAVKENGIYNIYNDAPSEVSVFSWRIEYAKRSDLEQFHSKNTIQALAFLRMVIPALLEVSQALDVDAGLRAGWEEFLAHLAPYPTRVEEDGKKYFRSVDDEGYWQHQSRGFRYALHLTMPCGVTGQYGDPEIFQTAKNTFLREVDENWFHFNMFCMVYPSAARLGYDPNVLLEKLKGQCLEQGFPNMWTYHGGGGIEDLSAVPNTIQEMLLQSYEGIITIIPNWPAGKPASFAGWLADGAFEVDAAYDGSTVTSLSICSLKGRQLVLRNPWPGRQVLVSTNGSTTAHDAAILTLPTEEGQRFEFSAK